MEKITFTMGSPDPKKHSTRFDLDKIESVEGVEVDAAKFKPSFYVPLPVAKAAQKIRVTIEVIG